MAGYTAQDVKRLREETDAPMMECKGALEEAGGDFEKAKIILREKGKAAAAKRADRNTAAGVVAISHSHDHQRVGGIVLECETDFVARNEGFIAVAKELAEVFLDNDPGSDPLAVKHGDKTVGDIVEGLVATYRENCKLTKALHLKTADRFAIYVHHDNMKAIVVEVAGDAEKAGDAGRTVAIQAVAFPPEFISRDEVPSGKIEEEIKIETERAIKEGKPENVAKQIAQGRVNKEYFSRVVLMDQPLYKDMSKTVGQFIKESGDVAVKKFYRLAVGEGS
ncbi:MAG: translation elongation factor Ts [Armatimonadetes bacterium]|nr:translation elongation factor Ts [Armatimonadota bacterium]